MKLFYKSIMFLTLFIFCVGSVCAADTTDLDSSLSGTDLKLVDATDNNIICDEDTNNDLDDGSYCCGAVAFQNVLKENGIDITLDEANKAIHSVNGTTSMQGLIDGAKKYNLTAYPVKLNTINLKSNVIVHLDINGTGHWDVIKNITNSTVYLNNMKFNISSFNEFYTNKSIILSTNVYPDLNVLTKDECNITGTTKTIKELKYKIKSRCFKDYNILKCTKVHYKTILQICYKIHRIYNTYTQIEYKVYTKVLWTGHKIVPIWALP